MFGSPEAFAGAAPDEAAQFALDACLWGEEGEETLGPSADGAKAAKAKLVEGNTLICSNLEGRWKAVSKPLRLALVLVSGSLFFFSPPFQRIHCFLRANPWAVDSSEGEGRPNCWSHQPLIRPHGLWTTSLPFGWADGGWIRAGLGPGFRVRLVVSLRRCLRTHLDLCSPCARQTCMSM